MLKAQALGLSHNRANKINQNQRKALPVLCAVDVSLLGHALKQVHIHAPRQMLGIAAQEASHKKFL